MSFYHRLSSIVLKTSGLVIRRFRGIGRKRLGARGKVYRASLPARLSLINNLINSPLVTWDKVKDGLSRKRKIS